MDNRPEEQDEEQDEEQGWVNALSAEGERQSLALAELSRLLQRRLLATFSTKAGVDKAFVEDVVQDATVKILDSLEQFQGRSKFTTWATTIAIRMAITELRRLRWKDTSLDQLMEKQGSDLPGNSHSETADSQAEQSQLVESMYQVIHQELTEKQKTVLLAELAGMPQEEIGRRIGSNRNAIYKLAHDARKRLKKGLVAAGYSAADLTLFVGSSQ